jgi:RHS repeat-associated protein
MIPDKIKIHLMYHIVINTVKAIFLKTALLSCFLLFLINAKAQKDGGIEEKQSAKRLTGLVGTVKSFPLLENQSTIIDYATFAEQSVQQNKKIKNVITFSIDEESAKFISQDFTATATVIIEYGHDVSSLESITKDFTVDYKKADGAKYNARQYFYFDNAEYVKITLQSITAPSVGSVDTHDVLSLENSMIITRYFELPDMVPAPLTFDYTIPVDPIPVDPIPVDPIPDHLTVNWSWPSNTGNNATQLEWTWIEDEMESNYVTNDVVDYELVFKNSSRVDLPYGRINYDIPLLYEGTGKLYYRIRAVNFKESGTRSDGPWNLGNAFAFAGHNNDLNWQASTSFAEDGKRKTVIQYFDGSLRGRQTVTKDNTTNTVVKAESFYDAQGRPAIQILPSPGMSNIIQYQANLNLFNGQTQDQDPAEIFDMQPVVTTNNLTPPLLTSTGTSNYYSPANLTGPANIPDAEGYPYTVTRYTPDATGRVMAQSGVGLAHKMGSGHETKYYYGGASQEELDGLFGTEAGNFTHYSKNMVKDANGQMSVSYVDMHGRTVATALAGDAPSALVALDNNNPLHYPNQAGTNITRNLLDYNSNVVKNNSIESVNSLLVPVLTKYDFTYELNPAILQMAACNGDPATLCYDCLYDLEISITDESGETPPAIYQFNNVSLNPDDDCSTPIPQFKDLSNNNRSNTITFSSSLQPGSYSIRKTLSISESSFQYYKDLYMSKAVCKTEQELVDSIYNVLLLTTNCEDPTPVTCQNCLTQLGLESDYRINYRTSLGLADPSVAASVQIENDITRAYNTALQNCSKLCNNTSQSIPTIREMMLMDMISYSGQYAMENADSNTVAGVHTMFDKYNIFSTAIPATQPFYIYPWDSNKQLNFYYDDANNKDITIHPETPPAYAFLNGTTKLDFQQLFKNSWAASLLPHHPEYDRLIFAETYLTPSYNWINTFTQTDSYFAAQSNGYLDPLSSDPFFQQATSYATLMNGSSGAIANYQGMGVGIWQLAYGDVRYKSILNDDERRDVYQHAPNTPPPYTGFTEAENDQAWKVFRGLYTAIRNNYVNEYIAVSRPLPSNDEADLITQKFRLWFPRNNKQNADQNGWTWWPANTGDEPTGEGAGGGAEGASDNYSDNCTSYINTWKTKLLQCEALANHPDKGAILDAITTRMREVCINGSNASNIYGASDVAPNTPATVTDRSFEDVIKNVFIQYGIIDANGVYKDAFCNPFVIEWPKPYGKSPKMMDGELTNQVDDCNCSQYLSIRAQAIAQNVDVSNLEEFNQYLMATHGDILSAGMFAALEQHCGNSASASPACVCNDLNKTLDLYYAQYPNGGLDTCISNYQADLQINSRTGNQPAEYVATNSVNFLSNFESGVADSFVAYISAGCDPVSSCHDLFTNFFNSQHNYGFAYTWFQIDSLYQANCHHSPYVCGYKNYGCDELQNVLSLFTGSNSLPGSECQQNFTDFFNNYYHNIIPLTFTDVNALYIGCDQTNLAAYICDTSTVTYRSIPPALNCKEALPYILPQPLPLPNFLKCGYVPNPPCLSCAGLSSLTGEYKAAFTTAVNAAPIFTGTNLTTAQVASNMSYARFINYRTGYQFTWLQYAQAAASAAPVCDLGNYNNNSSAQQNVICGSARPLADTVTVVTEAPCVKVYTMAVTLAQQIYQTRQQYLLQQFDDAYKEKCLAAKDIEQFTVKYKTSEYHYTLYYYDMAGNLVKTVPPKGVNPDFSASFTNSVKEYRTAGDYTLPAITPVHTLTTDYRYNSLNQVSAQNTPDAATSHFWYDALGRLVASQNAQQLINNKYSYTLYDAIGRITEVGQKPQAANSMDQVLSQNPVNLDAWINTGGGTKEQITFTVYDQPFPPFVPDPTPLVQQNLRNRVSYTATKNLATDEYPAATTFYTYDIHGNVDKLLQDYYGVTKNMAGANSRYKLLTYDYDLISGKVNQVNYQPGFGDAFYHRYNYDAENRLISVETSRDRIVWERDAAYNYYKHGPLARMELGQLRVQGTDYSYTLQGLLKGTNQTSLDPTKDPGLDGSSQSTTARDALSFALHYYDETVNTEHYIDFKPVAGNTPFAIPGSASGIKSLYNGNIAAMSVNNAGLLKAPASGNNTMALLYNYRYDQLNRIVSMQAYKGLNAATNQWNAINIDDYKEAVSYDPNGNILTYDRNGSATRGAMDEMSYTYKPSTNQLDKVADIAPDVAGDNDIKKDQSNGNYQYDHIGNLTADAIEGIIGIDWNVYGKILSIHKSSGDISYAYDASGNRISKTVAGKTTIYVRDATGNVMSVYESISDGEPAKKENHLYGSSRLGIQTELTVAPVSSPLLNGFGSGIMGTFTRGEKFFELSNHLGNVLATVSDKKIAHSTDGTIIDYYNADIISAQDYYPGGMGMPGRKYSLANTNYRYGFNGKENDNEVKGEGNQQNYGMRIYDPRLGKFLSVDPLTKNFPFYSPYHFAGNNPIANKDLDGGEPQNFMVNWQYHSLFNPKSGASNGMNISVDDPKLGHVTVEGVYDSWTKQTWFIHQDDQGNSYYLKNINGDKQTLSYSADPHHKLIGGQFEKFETQDAKQTRLTNEFLDNFSIFFAGGITAIAAAPVVVGGASLLPSLGEASVASRSTNVLFDYGTQVAGNYIGGKKGADAWINNINGTSLAVSIFNPVKGVKSLAFNSIVANAFSITAKEGYNGLGGGKSVTTFAEQSVISFVAGSLTLGSSARANQLQGRLRHVSNLFGNNNNPIANSIQKALSNTERIGGAIGAVSGTTENVINDKIEK